MKKVNKYLHIVCVALVLSALAVIPASASEKSEGEELARGSAEELLSDFSLIVPDGMEGVIDGSMEQLDFAVIIDELFGVIRGEMPSFVGFLFLLIGAAILLMLVGQLGEAVGAVTRSAVSVAVGCVILFRLIPMLVGIGEAFSELRNFFSLLIPILVSGAALGGGAVAASGGSGMTLTLTLIGGACEAVIPLSLAAMMLGVLSTLAPDVTATPLEAVRRNLTRAFAVLTAVVGGLFSLQTAVASAQDGGKIRALKYAVGNTVPVVGGAVSGTLSTLVGGLGYAMGVVGGGGVAVMLSLALLPLARLLLYRLAFFLAFLFLDCFPLGEGARVIRAISAGLDSLVAVFSLTVAVYMLETVVVMKGVLAIF